MKYVKVLNGIVDAVRFQPKDGYIEAGDEVFAGFTHSKGVFSPPAPVPPAIPDSVSARQFKLQLEIQGLTASVEAWVAAQPKLIRIAYENSGAFDRTEPMLQAGFKALGFSKAALETFYTEAAKL